MSTQVNNIPRLNEANFKDWKEDIQIVLWCMDLDLALRVDRPTSIEENPNKVEIEKWDRSNRMCLMIMKRSILETFRGSIVEGTNAKGFLKQKEQYFTKNDKAEVDSGATNHVSVSMQSCIWSRPPSDAEAFIYVADDNRTKVKAIGTFRLSLGTGFHLYLILVH
ncbi:uncharacterized protein LOC111025186 [Momordica charantia]|uniref:Uncharacterized protein LOC111025186 n=1 Tax=Momordica charantia TaxID=3673 RepID=A0A6J1E084_MOMCH|nr:uncharacterized protein LOC111025186 [Momordica charantia]